MAVSKTFREKYIDQTYDWELLTAVLTEFVCTIVFIFGIMTLTFLQLGPAVSGLVIFFLAALVIYAFGGRSGAIFNPAITLGLMVGGKMNLIKGLIYIVVEFLGGLLAGAFFLVFYPDFPDGTSGGTLLVIRPGLLATNLAAIAMELIASFILVLTVFRVVAGIRRPFFVQNMTKKQYVAIRDKRSQFAIKMFSSVPLGIAAALGFLSFPSSYVSGGAYNPARALGGCVAGGQCGKIWVYFLGDFIGGALAGLFHFWFLEHPHRQEEDIDESIFYANEVEVESQ